MRPTLVYITCKDEKEAKKIAEHLLLQKLISCANITKINSMYWWQGDIKDEKEALLLCKSFDKKYKQLEKEVKEIHSYEVPAVMEIPIESISKEYEKWSEKELK